MRNAVDFQHGIDVRWGLHEDETRIAELLELNGVSSRVAEKPFIVAERDGNVVAALRYETKPKKLVLGLLVTDPRISELILAVALYSRVPSWRLRQALGRFSHRRTDTVIICMRLGTAAW